jgi:hypothetical protein
MVVRIVLFVLIGGCALIGYQTPPLDLSLDATATSCICTDGYYYRKAPFYNYIKEDSTESTHVTIYNSSGYYWGFRNYFDTVLFLKIESDLTNIDTIKMLSRGKIGKGTWKCIDDSNFIINNYQPSAKGTIPCYKYGRVLNDTTIVIDSIRYLDTHYEPFAYVTDTSFFRRFDAIPDTIPPFVLSQH